MTSDRSVLERMTAALAGSPDMEVMGALGMAQIATGRIPPAEARQLRGLVDNGTGGMALVAAIGRGLTALQTGATQASYDDARELLAALVARLNRLRRWGLHDRNERRVAEGALLMHLHPSCPHCHGRRYELTPGTDTVGERTCRPCGATGQRPYPKRFKDEIAAVLSILGLIQGLAERAVAREMAR